MFVPNTTSRPPADMAMPQTEQLIFTIATQIPFIIFFSVGLRQLATKGDPKPLLFGIGGCLASAFEPVVDVLGFCYFPRAGNWIAFETFGRPIPVFVPATYGWFVGGMGYWFWSVFQDPETSAKDIPVLWFKAFIINLILEYPPLYYGIYTYYGFQPLVVGGSHSGSLPSMRLHQWWLGPFSTCYRLIYEVGGISSSSPQLQRLMALEMPPLELPYGWL